jgi:hypothetical protein
MEAADLAMYALYIGIFISPIQILVELTEMMQKGLSGFRRFSSSLFSCGLSDQNLLFLRLSHAVAEASQLLAHPGIWRR